MPACIEVENPATGELVASVPIVAPEDVTALAANGRMVQPTWAAAGFARRAAVLDASRQWLMRHRERMLATIMDETGKTYEDAQMEVSVAALGFKFWADHAERYLADARVPARSAFTLGRKVVVRYEPRGLVGVIAPWNYPLVNAFCDCVPALMAGCAVLLKPSEVTPLTALLTAEMLDEVGMPRGVFQVVTGAADTGAAVVDVADYVMFTGSARTGQAIMRRAAETLTPVSLELGGKDPMIVCADADLERAANAAAYYGLVNSGQACVSVERVYVEASVHDEFVRMLVANVRELRQGIPGPVASVEVGALTFGPQIDTVDSHVQDAIAQGARVEIGGRRRPGPGLFYEPTVLTGVTHAMRCVQEETFGPTIPVIKVADVDEAIQLANDSEYGLQASVWTRDVPRGEALARRIEAGAVVINDVALNYAAMAAPMGGWKRSGLGSRHGASGIRKYCHAQTVMSQRFAPKKDLHMFPYAPWRSKLAGAVVARLYGRDISRGRASRRLRRLTAGGGGSDH